MKVYEFLEATPQMIGSFQRELYSSWRDNYNFPIRSKKEKEFFIKLDGCYDSILWYEDSKYAYELFGYYGGGKVQFSIMEYKVTEDEEEPYIDDASYEIKAKTIKTAVNKFVQFLNKE